MVKLRKSKHTGEQAGQPAERRKLFSFSIRRKPSVAALPAPDLESKLQQWKEQIHQPLFDDDRKDTMAYRRSSSKTLVNGAITGEVEYMNKIFDDEVEEEKAPIPVVLSRSTKPLPFPEEPSDYTGGDMRITTPSQRALANIPAKVWTTIADMASPADAASLAYTSRILRYRLGAQPWRALADHDNVKYRHEFLAHFDYFLPGHLYCFNCALYHPRLDPGKERLYPTYVDHPVFACSQSRSLPLPRTRLAHGRELPYNLVQLAVRGKSHSPEHGIPASALARGWKCRDSDWSHRTMFYVHKGHLLMRCASTCFTGPDLTPSEQRLLLFSRSEYAPYFSVCDHWQYGDLMQLAKCALSHVPKARQGITEQLRKGPRMPNKSLLNPDIMPRQCDDCKPLRRCPACPTEYMIEIKIVEDPKDTENRFKHAICVTRWSDLGDGSSPITSPEWLACNGQIEYDSFAAISRATLCSHFEGAVSHHTPNQNCLPLWNRRREGDVY